MRLLEASQYGLVDDVKQLLREGCDVNFSCPFGSGTPLYKAAGNAQVETVKLLLRKGADPSKGRPDGDTPMHYACFSGSVEVLELLRAAGADPAKPSGTGWLPIYEALKYGHRGVYAYLLDRKATAPPGSAEQDAAAAQGFFNTAQWGPDPVRELLAMEQQHGCFDPARPHWGACLHWCATGDFPNLAQELIDAGVAPTCVDSDGYPALVIAAQAGNTGVVNRLLTGGAPVDSRVVGATEHAGETALTNAVGAGWKETIRLLLYWGADPNARSQRGRTPLHAAAVGHSVDGMFLLFRNRETPNVNAQDDGGWTPLHFAAAAGDIKCAWALVKYGANLNLQAADGNTPLHAAASQQQRDVARVLISNGADVSIRNKHRSIPRDLVPEEEAELRAWLEPRSARPKRPASARPTQKLPTWTEQPWMATKQHRGCKIWYGKLLPEDEVYDIVNRLNSDGRRKEAELKVKRKELLEREREVKKLVFKTHDPTSEHAYKINGNYVAEYRPIRKRTQDEVAQTTQRLYRQSIEKKIEKMNQSYAKYVPELKLDARALFGPKPPGRQPHPLAARPQSAK